MPAMIRRIWSRVRKPASPPTWSGVYADFRSVPIAGPGFEGAVWRSEMTAWASSLRAQLERGELEVPEERSQLSVLVGAISSRGTTVRIIDVGGGLGIDYLFLRAAVPDLQGRVIYQIVESPGLCDLGTEMYRDDPSVQFLQQIPAERDGVDIVHANGVLQFVEDFRGFIKGLAEVAAPYLSLVGMPLVSRPTYASGQQNVPGSVIPSWFLNRGDVEHALESQRYRIVTRTRQARVFSQDNFSPDIRCGRITNLLCSRVN